MLPDPAATSLHVELIAARELKPMPWKNGGGVTREIANYPAKATLDTFAWRVSLADVAQAGPFSKFSDIDRTLVVTRGGPMALVNTHTQAQHDLPCWEPYRFRGEASISARLPNGPTQDFNLMWRRDVCVGQLDVWKTEQILNLEPNNTFLHCAAGSFTVSLSRPTPAVYTLQAGDTLHIALPSRAALTLVVKPNQPDSRLIDARLRTHGSTP